MLDRLSFAPRSPRPEACAKRALSFLQRAPGTLLVLSHTFFLTRPFFNPSPALRSTVLFSSINVLFNGEDARCHARRLESRALDLRVQDAEGPGWIACPHSFNVTAIVPPALRLTF